MLEPKRIHRLEIHQCDAIFFEIVTKFKAAPIYMRFVKDVTEKNEMQLEPHEDVVMFVSKFNRTPNAKENLFEF